MTDGKPDKPDLPESIDEAESVLADESFFVPMANLPDDPEALQAHVEELYVQLARASTVLGYETELREWRNAKAEQIQRRSDRVDEHRERANRAMEDLGIDTDDDRST